MVGHGEQKDCRCGCNVMHLKMSMEFRFYFAVLAQMTEKKHKAQSHVPLCPFFMYEVNITNVNNINICTCLLSPYSLLLNEIL